MAAADPRSSSDGGPAGRGGFPAGESSNERDGPGRSGGEGEREPDRATFECNICLDTARDAVISMCGHLFWYETGDWCLFIDQPFRLLGLDMQFTVPFCMACICLSPRSFPGKHICQRRVSLYVGHHRWQHGWLSLCRSGCGFPQLPAPITPTCMLYTP